MSCVLMIAALAHLRRAPQPPRGCGLARMSALVRADGSPAGGLLARRPKVVFTDCDGTLLGPDHRLSDRARSALRALAASGVRVVPATGRARAGAWTEHVLSEPALRNGQPGIFLNGCSRYGEDGREHTHALTPAAARAAVAFGASRRDLATTVVYVGGEALVDAEDALTAKLAAVGDSPLVRVPCLQSALSAGVELRVAKVLLLSAEDEATAAALREAAAPRVAGHGAELTRALGWCLEVVPAGMCKARAAAQLLAQWGLEPADALALGDGENDVSLLRLCGASVAMGNGCAAAKQAARFLAPSNAEDGFAVAVETLVLGGR